MKNRFVYDRARCKYCDRVRYKKYLCWNGYEHVCEDDPICNFLWKHKVVTNKKNVKVQIKVLSKVRRKISK